MPLLWGREKDKNKTPFLCLAEAISCIGSHVLFQALQKELKIRVLVSARRSCKHEDLQTGIGYNASARHAVNEAITNNRLKLLKTVNEELQPIDFDQIKNWSVQEDVYHVLSVDEAGLARMEIVLFDPESSTSWSAALKEINVIIFTAPWKTFDLDNFANEKMEKDRGLLSKIFGCSKKADCFFIEKNAGSIILSAFCEAMSLTYLNVNKLVYHADLSAYANEIDVFSDENLLQPDFVPADDPKNKIQVPPVLFKATQRFVEVLFNITTFFLKTVGLVTCIDSKAVFFTGFANPLSQGITGPDWLQKKRLKIEHHLQKLSEQRNFTFLLVSTGDLIGPVLSSRQCEDQATTCQTIMQLVDGRAGAKFVFADNSLNISSGACIPNSTVTLVDVRDAARAFIKISTTTTFDKRKRILLSTREVKPPEKNGSDLLDVFRQATQWLGYNATYIRLPRFLLLFIAIIEPSYLYSYTKVRFAQDPASDDLLEVHRDLCVSLRDQLVSIIYYGGLGSGIRHTAAFETYEIYPGYALNYGVGLVGLH